MSGNRRQEVWRERVRGARDWLRDAWRNRRQRRVLIAFGALALGSFGTGAVAAAWTRACVGTCPSAEHVANFAPQQASQVLDAEGGLLGLFYRERRTVVPLQSLPRYVPMAFVAIEDQRFFAHEGVDPLRMVGAVRDNVTRGFGASGGSTITMQLARNLFPQQLPRGEKTFRRKVAEIKLALEMERRFPKRRILELYLNHIYLGAGAYGVEAAARTYFNKPAAKLTYVEAATLAALPKAPSYYNPRRNPEAATARRNLVLDFMSRTEVITPEQAEAAKRSPLVLAPPSGAIQAPYFVEAVRTQLEDQFGELLYTGGLRIHTGLDPKLQEAAEEGLEEQLAAIESGRYGHYPHVTYETFTQRIDGEEPTSTPYLQGLVVALDPRTGVVRSLVGGRDFEQSQFNRATRALRQPGSAFKPFVYAAALEQGMSPLHSVSDSPFSLALSDGSVWSPKNYDGEYGGPTTLREGLRNSRNMVAIRAGREAGIEAVRDVAKRAGIDTKIPGYPSVYIGAAGVQPIDMIAAYATFANGGNRVEPRLVVRVEDNRGAVLWEPPVYPQPAVDPAIAWILTDMLREVVDRGTGYNARNPAVGNLPYTVPAAGKTGTTNGSTDIWFVGYTPDLVAGVWMGMDQPRTIMRGATGGMGAVPVWARVVRTAYEGRPPPEEWPRPPGVVTRRVSGGRVVSADCPYGGGGFTDLFAARHVPEPVCVAPPLPERRVDPTPHLPGRPIFPGEPRVPRPEDYVRPPQPERPAP